MPALFKDTDLNSIYQEIARKRALLGIVIKPTTEQRKIKRFSSDVRYLVGMNGILPYRVVNNVN